MRARIGRVHSNRISLPLHVQVRHLRRDIISFNTAIDGCQGKWGLSLAVLAKMSHQNLEPDVIAHDTASFLHWRCLHVLRRSFAVLRPSAPLRKVTTGIVPWICYGPSRPVCVVNDLSRQLFGVGLVYMYAHTHTYVHIYIYIHMCVSMYMYLTNQRRRMTLRLVTYRQMRCLFSRTEFAVGCLSIELRRMLVHDKCSLGHCSQLCLHVQLRIGFSASIGTCGGGFWLHRNEWSPVETSQNGVVPVPSLSALGIIL